MNKTSPYTGSEYIESLRDGRTVFIGGERVADVTIHPAFRNSVRSIARMYDAMHDAEMSKVLMTGTDTGNGGQTHRFFKAPRSSEEMVQQREAIAAWARLSYGWMGRSPDFKAALSTTFGAYPEFYGEYAPNVRAWYKKIQESVLFMNHAIVNPPVDRGRSADAVRDVCVKVEKETDAGIYVSGAKVVATGAVLTQWNFVGQAGRTATDDPSMAVMFMLPVGAPGCKLICRTSYEGQAAKHGAPFDYPLSSRFDENDSIFVLDNVFVPWENVVVYRDLDKVMQFYQGSGFLQSCSLQACTRFSVKLDFLAGVVARALKITGGDAFRGNQVLLGEIMAMRHMFWSFTDAMVGRPEPWNGDYLLPNLRACISYRTSAPAAFARVREIAQKIIASSLIYLPSSAKDLDHPEIAPYLERYVRGSNGVGYRERIKVMKLLWDSVGTEFSGRHELYERNYAGNHEEIRLQALATAQKSGAMQSIEELVDNCLGDYDESGWTRAAWAGSKAGAAPEVAA
ncbi:4-hydroxyphenylacetate 3-hydroxylase N-terminal domain-containing protein [Pusillimonas noertemannii]|uniref:4-hydroxyphenylacetate 3-hydroxylase N-terminal domain-containing protein n=1 Tax=Pusillimonas noertemannii TaxID=305977 RepID=UPI00030A7143|nr:4-hydroxyphenylacetate 3-hydroxylase N-terminal domain-containing protein [Pusillimonas noertemannii]